MLLFHKLRRRHGSQKIIQLMDAQLKQLIEDILCASYYNN